MMKSFLLTVASLLLSPAIAVGMPHQQAARFCRLLVQDADGNVLSAAAFLRQHPLPSSDSLSAEQLFADYVFNHGGWQMLRVFPHADSTGFVSWYSATSELPSAIDAEHCKYIREVFPRMSAAVRAGDWKAVDEFTTSITVYQTTFARGRTPVAGRPSSVLLLVSVLLAAFLLSAVAVGVQNRRKRKKNV